MNPRLVGKRICPDNCLVRRNRHTNDVGQRPGGRIDLLGHNPAGAFIVVTADIQVHYHLIHRRVSGTFADTVNGTLDLPGSRLNRRKRVCDRKTEIIMAVDRNNRLIDIFHMLFEIADKSTVLRRLAVSHGIRNIDGRGTGIDNRLHHLCQKRRLAAGRILRRELHILRQGCGIPDTGNRHLQNLFRRFAELVFHVNRTCRKEHMDSRVRRIRQCLPGTVDIRGNTAAETGNLTVFHRLGHRTDRLEISRTCGRESCFDDIYAE